MATEKNSRVFGPVLAVWRFHTEAEALAPANGTKYGLAGTVWINAHNKFYSDAEFGGYTAGGSGRTFGLDGPYEFTELKHINFDLKPTFFRREGERECPAA